MYSSSLPLRIDKVIGMSTSTSGRHAASRSRSTKHFVEVDEFVQEAPGTVAASRVVLISRFRI